jgi:hypothetical protein
VLSPVINSYDTCYVGRYVLTGSIDPKPALNAAFTGLRCSSVTRFGAESWRFEFEGRTTLDVRCPWRIIARGRIALGNGDHEQQFGLPKPVDAKQEAERLLGSVVSNVDYPKRNFGSHPRT